MHLSGSEPLKSNARRIPTWKQIMIDNLCWCQVVPFEATFLLRLLLFFASHFCYLDRHVAAHFPGVRPAAWPVPKPRFSSCFWGMFMPPSLLQYIYIYVYMCVYVCICVCVQIYIYIYTHLHIHIHKFATCKCCRSAH